VALQLTHSGVLLGAVTAARFVPLLVLGPWGGLIADRSELRRLLTMTQASAAVVSFVLAVMSLTGALNLPTLFVLVAALGLVNVFDGPSRQSLIGQLVDRPRLANAIALNSIAMNTARVAGPAVAGLLIATLGVTPCFFANAVSFVAVIVSLVFMRSDELIPISREERGKGQITAGLRHVRRTPTLLWPLVMVTVTGIFTWEFPVSLPLMTTETFHHGAAAYGTATSFLGLGSVCGGFLATRRSRVSVGSLALSSCLWGGLIVVAALVPTLDAEFAVLLFVGSAAITFNSAAKTLLQLESTPHMRGRVMSLWSIAWQGSTVVGAPIVGAVGEFCGARYALLVGGVAALAVGAPIALRRPERADPPPSEPAHGIAAEARGRAAARSGPGPDGS
jgi:MFS family permease